jgi:hypothetical protein
MIDLWDRVDSSLMDFDRLKYLQICIIRFVESQRRVDEKRIWSNRSRIDDLYLKDRGMIGDKRESRIQESRDECEWSNEDDSEIKNRAWQHKVDKIRWYRRIDVLEIGLV